MRKIEKISKKHKILKELSEQSDLFRKIKVLLIFVVMHSCRHLLILTSVIYIFYYKAHYIQSQIKT